MHRFFAATGRSAVRFRWAVVAAWVAAAVLATLLLPSLASVIKENNTGQLPASSPSLSAARLATPFQDPDQTPVLVVIARRSGTVTTADAAAIGRLTARLAKVANVQQVKDRGDSTDRQAVQLEVLAGLNLATTGPAQQLVTGLRAAITASALPRDLHAHLAGPAAAQADASQTGQKALSLGLDLSVVFIVALLLLVFRALLAPLLTLAPAVLVTQLAGHVIGEAGKAGLPVSSLTQVLMLILTIGAGTDYGLFLVFRVREELRAGRTPHEAVTRALARVGESITFSAATVIAALLTMLLATFGLYSSVGAPLAIALAVMLLADLTLLPALLAIVGRAAFWPSRTARGTGRTGWWGRIAGRAVAHPGATLAFGLVAFGALATAVLGYRPADLSTQAAPGGSDSAAGNALLAAHFPAAASSPTTVVMRFREPAWSDPAPVATAQRRLAALPQFASLAGPFDALTPGQLTTLHASLGGPAAISAVPPPGSRIPPASWTAYGAETQFISPNGRTVVFDARLADGDPGSNAALRQMPALRAAVAAVARATGASAYGVAGAVPAGYDLSQVSDADLLRIFPVAIIVIGLLLALVLRSLIAPLYLIASVVLSYLAAWGLSVLLFQDAAKAGGLFHGIPFLMFIFLLALGEDYNILVMTRIREEASRIPLRQAVTRALERTGPTVSSAGLILAGTFAVFALAVSRQPGGGLFILSSIAIGILMDAFLVRTLLVPATVALLGRWNWWPSRPRRVLDGRRPDHAVNLPHPASSRLDGRMEVSTDFAKVQDELLAAEITRLCDAMAAIDASGRYPQLTVERPWSAHNPVLEGEFAAPRAIRWYLERELGRLAACGARISVRPGRTALDLHDPELGPAVDETHWDLRRKKLFLFAPERMALSMDRLRHYTGTEPESFQRYVLLTNYAWHVEEFRAAMPGCTGPDKDGRQMPAWHYERPDRTGVTIVDIGVGPSNAKTLTDHLAVLRPDLVMMIGHCAGLRNHQEIGDMVLATGYMRDDHVLDGMLPLSVPVVPNHTLNTLLLSELTARGLPSRMGIVFTTADRNWELNLAMIEDRLRVSRAVAVDMESATVAANGFRYRIPTATLLAVSDKPLHASPKLSADAQGFYASSRRQHIAIAISVAEKARELYLGGLPTADLRSPDEPLLGTTDSAPSG